MKCYKCTDDIKSGNLVCKGCLDKYVTLTKEIERLQKQLDKCVKELTNIR